MEGEAAAAESHSQEVVSLILDVASQVASPLGALPLSSKEETGVRCRANTAHRRQSGPDSGLGVQEKVHKTFEVVPSSLGSGSTISF